MLLNKTPDYIRIGLLTIAVAISGCGKKLQIDGKGSGGGNGPGAFNIVRALQCNINSAMVLAQDQQNVSIRMQYTRSKGTLKAESLVIDGQKTDLATGANGVNCTGVDGETQIITVTIPFAGGIKPSSLTLNVVDTTLAKTSCSTQAIVAGNPFGDVGMSCQTTPGGNNNPAVVTANSSQFGTVARFTVATTETPANSTSPQLFVGAIDYGDGAPPKPIGIGSMTNPTGTPSIVFGDIGTVASGTTKTVRIAMFNSLGKRSVLQRTLAVGQNLAPNDLLLVEDSRGILVPNLSSVQKPKALPPNDIVVVGHGEANTDSVVGYHIPSGRKIYQVTPFTTANNNKKGTRVALGDVDNSGNLSVVVTQENERELEIYNNVGSPTPTQKLDVEDFLKSDKDQDNLFRFRNGTNAAIYYEGGLPKIALTTQREQAVSLVYDTTAAKGFRIAALGKPLGDGVSNEVRVAALGSAVAFTVEKTQSGKKKGIFAALANLVTGGDADGENPYLALGYSQPKVATGNLTAMGSSLSNKGYLTVYRDGVKQNPIMVFDQFNGGVRTATADVNGDGVSDIIVAKGKDGNNNGPASSFVVYDGKTLQKIGNEIIPFPGNNKGLYVSGYVSPR